MKTLPNKLVLLSLVSFAVQPIIAGPAPGYLETLRSSLKPTTVSSSVTAPVAAADAKTDEKAAATAAATAVAKPAPRFKVVTSGPPKNMVTHVIYLDADTDQPTRLAAKK